MTLASVLLGIWLVLVGLVWASMLELSTTFLGFWALVTGIIWLIELWHPLNLFRHR